ncbi:MULTISPECIES: phosphatase PAP2 family protein [unclassified Vibrio]|nr:MULTISPECIES: phosphatase PAP2 family protein [unclassified Vibrio]
MLEANIEKESTFQKIYQELYKDVLLYIFVLSTCIITFLIYIYYKERILYEYQLVDYVSRLINCLIALLFAWSIYFYFKMMLSKKDKLFKTYFLTLLGMLSKLEYVIVFIVRLILINICIANYTYLKQIIPDINPFYYDNFFFQLDKLLHGGVSPWEVSHDVFYSSYWTFLFNFAYNLWFIFIWGAILYFMWYCKDHYVRQAYLLSFFMSWFFIGGILAILMSSAGPCFVHLLDPENTHYQPLMERLSYQVDSFWLLKIYGGETSQLQSYLWQAYSNRSSDIGAGISAMPSMHISSSVLLAIGAFKVNKKIGLLFWLFTLIIMIASVHLGWHYAVDGYVAIVVTLLTWRFAKFILKRQKLIYLL